MQILLCQLEQSNFKASDSRKKKEKKKKRYFLNFPRMIE